MIIKYLANSWPSLEDKDKLDLDETKRPNLGLLKAFARPEMEKKKKAMNMPQEPRNKREKHESKASSRS